MEKKKPTRKSSRKRKMSPALDELLRAMLPDLDDAHGPEAWASALVDQAMDSPHDGERAALAQEALETWPDCADAHLLLADQESSPARFLERLQEAVAAGERAIGPKNFQKWQGHFWGFMPTRPYMRARHELANALWMAGRREEAIQHYREMLRLNPNDNQGMRYILINCLLELHRDKEVEHLLQQYAEDGAAEWAYAKVLLEFRRHGDSDDARRLLKRALDVNRYVPDYLVGNKPVPHPPPPYIQPGHESEAAGYAVGGRSAWKATPGAVTWLRQTLKIAPSAGARPRSSRPRRDVGKLRGLSQDRDDVWQLDVRRLAAQLTFEGKRTRPWMLIVADLESGVPAAAELSPDRPDDAEVIDRLLKAMLNPNHGDPRRPAVIEVRLKGLHKKLSKTLAGIGVACELRKELEEVETLLAAASEELARAEKNVGPEESGSVTDDPAELPQQPGEVWQLAVARLDSWVEDEASAIRPWCVLVMNRTDNLILANELLLESPQPAAVWETVRTAMVRPVVAAPHRPGVVEVRSADHSSALESRLALLDVECVVRENLDQLDQALASLSQHLSGDKTTALTDVPGMTLDHLGGFFAAAAEFYHQAPWSYAPTDGPIQVECSKFESGPWWAVVMGQSGVQQGLALYDDLDYLKTLLKGRMSDEQAARGSSGFSIMYGEEFEMSARDVNAAEQHGWPIAGPEAFPTALRLDRGLVVRLPLAWELELLEACLRAIPDFARQATPEAHMSVPVATGKLDLRLQWLG
jgi:tetratricopeptide (TPR) repeat protein